MDIKALKPTDKNVYLTEALIYNTASIYANKSSDEYKSCGDITKSPVYSTLENMTAYLSVLKLFPSTYAKELKQMFNTLHRPIWKKMVTEYMHEPNDRNTTFTIIYTNGYRLLVGELSRIFASTKATKDGIVYDALKVQNLRKDYPAMVANYNANLDKELDKYIRSVNKSLPTVQEAATVSGLAALDVAVGSVVNVVCGIFNIFNNVFSSARELNPVSLMNAILTRSYDKKVEKLGKIEATYEATKRAYDEYMRLPASKRNARIEANYAKQIEKYNVKMEDMKAQLREYDARAKEEAADRVDEMKANHKAGKKFTIPFGKKKANTPAPAEKKPDEKPSESSSEEKKEEPKEDEKKDEKKEDNNEFDF